ncbi:MAG: rubrerythrin family protein [Alphaproteobacteria bacterium 40-19]|nr:MAG: rubrerythrin family protein [Alphaproteobacteria bacterium 40-19]
MTTFVGSQELFLDAVNSLIELDYDAVEAYEAAINRIDNPDYRSRLTEFKEDHQRHITELSELVRQHGNTPASGPSMKQWLTKGKVVLANIIGDKAILKAMLDNEQDTCAAYQAMSERSDQWEDAKDLLKNGLRDEKKHKAWIEQFI